MVELVGLEPRHGVRHHVVDVEVHPRPAEVLAPHAASVVAALDQLVRCPQHRDPVLLLHPIDAGIDPLAQVFRGEGVIGLGVQYGSDRPLDPTWPPAHKRFPTDGGDWLGNT